jgi:hypothetical protein
VLQLFVLVRKSELLSAQASIASCATGAGYLYRASQWDTLFEQLQVFPPVDCLIFIYSSGFHFVTAGQHYCCHGKAQRNPFSA